MKRKLFSLIILCLFAVFNARAQTKVITGKVIAVADGLPIPAVSVRISGSKIATQTDADGDRKSVV